MVRLVNSVVLVLPRGLELGRAKDLHVYRLYNFKYFIVICSQYHTQVLQASSGVPL